MNDRERENARTLAALLGIDTADAARRLQVGVLVTHRNEDEGARQVAEHLEQLIGRTVGHVGRSPDQGSWAAEIVIGDAPPATAGPVVRVSLSGDDAQIGPEALPVPLDPTVHPMSLLILACYGCAAVLRAALGGLPNIPGPTHTDTFAIALSDFYGSDRSWMTSAIHLTDTYLAGAGAIGNGFLYALRMLQVEGELAVVDSDHVGDGNLNRCVWFGSSDLDEPKATRLTALAQPSFTNLRLRPFVKPLQQLKRDDTKDDWLKRLIVGIDTRRGRRALQNEIPGEVFDASTTGIVEVVLHYHRQPNDGACLACLYYESADEVAHERHVADALGLSLADVQAPDGISRAAAEKIVAKYPKSQLVDLVGSSCDSLFKQLCSEATITTSEGKQVLAPFCFVSVLAGACLAIELGRRLSPSGTDAVYNVWRLNPWTPPVMELKQFWPRKPGCSFCSNPMKVAAAESVWSPRC